MNPTERRIVFISGLHRSGTSVLHRLLAAHPQVSGFHDTGAPEDEGQHLQSVYPPAKPFGGPGRFGFDPRSHMDETHPLATPENAERIFAEWSRHWRADATVLVEKSPPNLVRTRFLQALFPTASFITLLRHPVAVTCATEKWRPKDGIDRLLEHWVVCHERFEADRPHLHRSTVVRYEELVTDPERVLAELFRFVGVEPVPAGEPVHSRINGKYFERWEELRRGFFSRSRLRRATERFEDRVRAFGYSLHEPEQGRAA